VTAADAASFTATPLDVPVTWAVRKEDADRGWRTAGPGVDCFLLWRDSVWCEVVWERFGLGIPSGKCSVRMYLGAVQEYEGRVLAFSPDGYALVMESTRALVVLPVTALRVVDTLDAP
jgi:hypothetical protein